MARCLEELENPKQVVSFLGHDFSLGFIPLGQSIPLIQGYQDMMKLEKHPQTSTQQLLMAKVDMIANFCSFVYPHIDQKYILEHAQLAELDSFFVKLIQCVIQELTTLNQSQGQTEASKKRRSLGKKVLIYSVLFLAAWKSMFCIIII